MKYEPQYFNSFVQTSRKCLSTLQMCLHQGLWTKNNISKNLQGNGIGLKGRMGVKSLEHRLIPTSPITIIIFIRWMLRSCGNESGLGKLLDWLWASWRVNSYKWLKTETSIGEIAKKEHMPFGCDYSMPDFAYSLHHRNEFNHFLMVMTEAIICTLVKMIFSVPKLTEETKHPL